MLNRYPLIHSSDFEQTRATHAAYGLGLEPAAPGTARGVVRSRANGYDHADLQLFAYHHDIDMTLTAGLDNPHYWVAVPVRKDAQDSTIRLSRRAGRVASPTRKDPLRLAGETITLGLCIKQHAMMNFAAPYLGDDNLASIVFDPRFDISRPAFSVLGQMVAMIVTQEEKDAALLSDPIRLRAFRDMAIATLMHFCPNTHSARLRGAMAAPGPRDVRRVIDLIRAEPQRALTLADLVAVAQVPGRTLNAHFQSFTGLSPMAYLRRARLGHARQLLQSGAVATVTDAALDAGLTHLGRFAADYRQTFGERPSRTLAKSRKR